MLLFYSKTHKLSENGKQLNLTFSLSILYHFEIILIIPPNFDLETRRFVVNMIKYSYNASNFWKRLISYHIIHNFFSIKVNSYGNEDKIVFERIIQLFNPDVKTEVGEEIFEYFIVECLYKHYFCHISIEDVIENYNIQRNYSSFDMGIYIL
jgi:hypothetical protein